MRTEHWALVAGMAALLASQEANVATWADLLNVKTVLRMLGGLGIVIRAAYVPTKDKP